MEPTVQVSLDLVSIEDAMPVAEVAARAGVDWLEAGTPLILGEGLHAVKALRKAFPSHPIVADLKTMDAGYLEAEMMFKAGATHVVVMGVAHPATIANAVRAGRDYGGKVMGDIMIHPDKPACARMMQELGVDYIIVHTGLDERNAEKGKSPMDDLASVVAAVTIPVQAVGGLSVEQAIQMPKLGAPLVVIGAPLVVENEEFKPSALDTRLYDLLRRIVTEVKAQGSSGARG
jgi:3-hexulose-6-phosphate synthase/6-phospho-3-hexuloisomerase